MCTFRDYVLDANGKETHMFWEAASLDMTRSRLLPATAVNADPVAGGHARDCTFRPPFAVASILQPRSIYACGCGGWAPTCCRS